MQHLPVSLDDNNDNYARKGNVKGLMATLLYDRVLLRSDLGAKKNEVSLGQPVPETQETLSGIIARALNHAENFPSCSCRRNAVGGIIHSFAVREVIYRVALLHLCHKTRFYLKSRLYRGSVRRSLSLVDDASITTISHRFQKMLIERDHATEGYFPVSLGNLLLLELKGLSATRHSRLLPAAFQRLEFWLGTYIAYRMEYRARAH